MGWCLEGDLDGEWDGDLGGDLGGGLLWVGAHTGKRGWGQGHRVLALPRPVG